MHTSEEELQELKQKVAENHELALKNNKILQSLYRHSIVTLVLRFVWLFLLIGIPFVAYIWAKPFITSANDELESYRAQFQRILSIPLPSSH